MGMRSPTSRVALGVAVITWASAFPMIRMALDAYTPLQIAFLRFGLAAAILAGYAVVARVRLPPRGDLLRIAGLGVLGIGVYGVLLGWGQKQVPAGAASLLIASSPMWMIVLAAAFSAERPSGTAIAGMLVSFVGVALIARQGGGGLGLNLHALAVLAAAIVGAAYTVFLRPYTLRYGAAPVTLVAAAGATLALFPGAIGVGDAVRAASPAATAAVLYLGIVPAVLGYGAWAYASARASAASAGAALYLIPVVAMVLSNWLLGEVPRAGALLGGALVLAGVVAAQRGRVVPRPTPCEAGAS